MLSLQRRQGFGVRPASYSLMKSSTTASANSSLMDVSGKAVTLGAAMNHAALNIANALGAWLGGVVIAAGYGYRAPALVGAGLAAAGLGILVISALVARRSVLDEID